MEPKHEAHPDLPVLSSRPSERVQRAVRRDWMGASSEESEGDTPVQLASPLGEGPQRGREASLRWLAFRPVPNVPKRWLKNSQPKGWEWIKWPQERREAMNLASSIFEAIAWMCAGALTVIGLQVGLWWWKNRTRDK